MLRKKLLARLLIKRSLAQHAVAQRRERRLKLVQFQARRAKAKARFKLMAGVRALF